MMNIKVIKTEADYEAALERIEALMDAMAGSAEEDELEVLSFLVEAYEKVQFPIDNPTPIEAITFFMDQNNLSNRDMVPYLGSLSKVSEVLNGKRSLSKTMIRKLVEGLGIPAEILLEVQPAPEVSGYVMACHESRNPIQRPGGEHACAQVWVRRFKDLQGVWLAA